MELSEDRAGKSFSPAIFETLKNYGGDFEAGYPNRFFSTQPVLRASLGHDRAMVQYSDPTKFVLVFFHGIQIVISMLNGIPGTP